MSKRAKVCTPKARRPKQRQDPGSKTEWPAWPQPKSEDLLELARTMAPFERFLDLAIVDAVVEDNRRFGSEWSASLEALGIDPATYLWEGSPCAFPGEPPCSSAGNATTLSWSGVKPPAPGG